MARHLSRLLRAPIRGRGRGLARDERGATLIEFGLFFPILALLVLGTIDLGSGLAARFALEQATQRTIELAALGGRVRADYSYLVTEAANAADVPADQVTLDQWLECDNVRQSSFSGVCPTGQQTARYVSITVYKDYSPNFRWLPIIGSTGTQADGSIRMTADSGLRVQ